MSRDDLDVMVVGAGVSGYVAPILDMPSLGYLRCRAEATGAGVEIRRIRSLDGMLSNTWVLIILTDYFICRRMLKLGRANDIGFHEDEVRRWNLRGLISLGVAVFVGALGILAVYPISYACVVALLLGPILQIALTRATNGRSYTPAAEPVGETGRVS
jgi:hypothetical protein